MNKGLTIGVGAVLIALAAFAGGWFAYGALGGGAPAAGPGAAMARLSDSERQQLQSMTEEERQAFFKEKGIEMPSGGPGTPGDRQGADSPDGAVSRGPGGGVQLLEGTVAAVSNDKVTITLTAGGSANVYVDTSTVVAAVDGGEATIVKGATVIVTSKPEAAGVNAAATVVVK